MTHSYFFELLGEEIPAWMLPHPTLLASLQELCTKELGTSADAVSVGATSRRIFLRIEGLPSKQADRVEEVKGPPKKAAYDASGNPTQALNGFLKKNNATIDGVSVEGDYVRLNRTVPGRSSKDILQSSIPGIIEGLRWPKTMRWGRGEYSFIRPLHSIISLFDAEPLPITILGVKSSNVTVGHRTLSKGTIAVNSYDDYVAKLRAASVVVDAKEREESMRERCRDLGREIGGVPRVDDKIWDQWRYLTEFPGIVRAEFRDEFLALPEEVLVTVMRVHQKQLPILRDEKLTNAFLAVIDNSGDGDGNAASGNSFVTNARFADAKFFYETDRKRTLESRLPDLEHLQFQEKLGDYRKKTERIEKIATAICRQLAISGNDAILAARISKCDLVTEMVKEFTDLQGRVGGIYAREEGLSPVVADAIYDHYLPLNLDDALPRNIEGAVVSVADKIDTLAGFFSIGLRPSGSKDPFGLRRAAQGVVQILLNRANWSVPVGIDQLIDLALDAYGVTSRDKVKSDLLEFFAERVRTLLEQPIFGFAYDEVAAAMEAGWAGSLTDLQDRIRAVAAVRDEADFLSLLDSAKRIANITAGAAAGSVSPALLQHDTEKRLHEIAALTTDQIDELTRERKYDEALRSFAGLAPELEKFFVDVMVMVDDEKVRNNRIALLQQVGSSARKIADVTRIVVARSDYKQSK